MNDPGKPQAYFIGSGWGCSERSGFRCVADHIIQADSIDQVIPALQEIEQRTHDGWYAFGYIAYEAAAAFGLPVLTNPSGHPPLLWFGLCKTNNIQQIEISDIAISSPQYTPPELKINLTEESYIRTIARIKQHIERGETYQVNYTVRANCIGAESGLDLFTYLYRAQPIPYAAFIQDNDWQIHSLSPELFLNKHSSLIESRPIKGTIGRGLTPEQDQQKIGQLKHSAKDQAENIMILDMMRNDLGRICKLGSVQSQNICRMERYRSLFHLTSSVQGVLSDDSTLTSIFQATFPAASITGAPKHRTMDIIRNYEDSPRSIYCGAIGFIKPDGDFTFNVAIRTMYGSADEYTLGVGGGIIWDSDPQMEYEEVKTKMAFARKLPADFQLIETLRLNQDGVYSFLDEHLKRLSQSANYWDYPCDANAAQNALLEYAKSVLEPPAAIRIALNAQGGTTINHRPITQPPTNLRVQISSTTVDSNNVFLYHKTTNREFYNNARTAGLKQGFFETIFANQHNHITEGCITNIFYRIGDHWFTPPIEDGLLAGIWRSQFMTETNAAEKSITSEKLKTADQIIIGNSVSGSMIVNQID